MGTEVETTGFMNEVWRPEDLVTTKLPGEVFGLLRFARDVKGKVDEIVELSGGVNCRFLGEGVDNPVDPADTCRFVVRQSLLLPRAD